MVQNVCELFVYYMLLLYNYNFESSDNKDREREKCEYVERKKVETMATERRHWLMWKARDRKAIFDNCVSYSSST